MFEFLLHRSKKTNITDTKKKKNKSEYDGEEEAGQYLSSLYVSSSPPPTSSSPSFCDVSRIERGMPQLSLSPSRFPFPSPFLSLPNEVSIHILQYLRDEDLLRCARTCTTLYALAQCNTLWKEMYADVFTFYARKMKKKGGCAQADWKAQYVHRRHVEANWKRGKCKQKILRGHSQPVWGVQFHKSLLASGGEDGQLHVWDLDRACMLRTLSGHDGMVNAFHFAGDYIASGADDRNAKLWDIHTGACLHTFVGHDLPVWMVEFNEDTLVSASCDRTLWLWDMHTGAGKMRLRGHTGRIYYLLIRDNLIYSASQDKTCRVWDMKSGECLHHFEGEAAAHCLQVNGDWLVSGHSNGNMCVWSLRTSAIVNKFNTGLHAVSHLQTNGEYVITSARENLYLWNGSSASTLPKVLKGHTDDVKYFQLKGNRLVSGGYDSKLRVWHLEDEYFSKAAPQRTVQKEISPQVSLEGHGGRIDWLEYHSDRMVSCASDCTIRLWDFT